MFRTHGQVLEFLAKHRCSAILRTDAPGAAVPAMQAAVDGGFRIVEFTLTTHGALEAISLFSREEHLLVGAGTVLSIAQAEAAVAAGARFLVSPVADPVLLDWCRKHQIVSIPGTFTPTEMWNAHLAGADIVKLFPAPANGPEYVKACLGPLPQLKIFPTSGVTEENCQDFLAAGAFGVGFVGTLFVPADLEAERFDQVRARAARMVARVATHRVG